MEQRTTPTGEFKEDGKMFKTVMQNCFWDGMSREEAILFYKRCYNDGVRPSDEEISKVIKLLRECTGREWR